MLRELKRLSSVTLSPVYAHFSETLAGLWTIRALRATQRFILQNQSRLDVNQRANYGSKDNTHWHILYFRAEFVCEDTCQVLPYCVDESQHNMQTPMHQYCEPLAVCG